MGTFLTVIILIICFLLGAVILVQNPKGGGLAAGFTGGAQMGGVQRTTDFLEKSTWYLVVALFISCIVAGIYNGNTVQNVGIDSDFLPELAQPTAPQEVSSEPAIETAPESAPEEE
jgi:preprotein translocase subunit SecG